MEVLADKDLGTTWRLNKRVEGQESIQRAVPFVELCSELSLLNPRLFTFLMPRAYPLAC